MKDDQEPEGGSKRLHRERQLPACPLVRTTDLRRRLNVQAQSTALPDRQETRRLRQEPPMSRAILLDIQPDNATIEGAAHVGNDHAAGPHLPYPRLWDVSSTAHADDSVKGRARRVSV